MVYRTRLLIAHSGAPGKLHTSHLCFLLTQRHSAMDILQNMLDECWLSKMKICGQVDKAWDCFTGAGEDEVRPPFPIQQCLTTHFFAGNGVGMPRVLVHPLRFRIRFGIRCA